MRRLFKDKGISGRAFKRLRLGLCLRVLAAGDILVVWWLDRLGRSLLHLIATMGQLEDRKTHFRSLTECFDATTPGRRLLFHMMATNAKFERHLITERTRARMPAARSPGKSVGRPARIAAEQMSEIVSLREEGVSLHEIAALYETGSTTIARTLKRAEGGTDVRSAETNDPESDCIVDRRNCAAAGRERAALASDSQTSAADVRTRKPNRAPAPVRRPGIISPPAR